MNIEEIKNYIAANPDDKEIQSLLNSHADKRVNSALENYKKNTELEKLKALENQIMQLQSENQQNHLKNIAKEKTIPDNLIDFVLGKDEEETAQKADRLLSALNGYIQNGVTQEVNIRLSGKAPVTGATPAGVSIANIKNLSSDEILKNLDQLNIGK